MVKKLKVVPSGGKNRQHFELKTHDLVITQPQILRWLAEVGFAASKSKAADADFLLIPDDVAKPSKSSSKAKGAHTRVVHLSEFMRMFPNGAPGSTFETKHTSRRGGYYFEPPPESDVDEDHPDDDQDEDEENEGNEEDDYEYMADDAGSGTVDEDEDEDEDEVGY